MSAGSIKMRAAQVLIETSAHGIAGSVLNMAQSFVGERPGVMIGAWLVANRALEIIEERILADPVAGPAFSQWRAEAEAEYKGGRA